jgi:O-antigen/teichoic acid export membrane protein
MTEPLPDSTIVHALRPGASASGAVRWTVTTTYVIQAMTVATGVVLARAFAPGPRGILAGALLWPTLLLAILAVGVGDALSFHVAKEERHTAAWVSTALVCVAVAATGVLVGLAIVVLVVPREVAALLRIFAWYVPLAYVTLVVQGTLLGLGRIRRYCAVRILSQALITAGLVTLFALDRLSLRSAAWVFVGAEVVTSLSALRLLGVVPRLRLAERGRARRLLSFGLRAHVASSTALLNERGDQAVIALFLAPAALGRYVIAVSVASPVALVGVALAPIALARFARGSQENLVPRLRRIVVTTAIVSSVVALVVIALARPAISVVYGHRYGAAWNIAVLLAVAGVPLACAKAFTGAAKGLGMPGIAGVGELGALVVTIAILFALVPFIGVVGAAWASLGGYLTSVLVQSTLLRRRLKEGGSP